MKRISFLMMALLLMGGIVMAQGNRRGNRAMDPKARAERMTERMAKEYSLNDVQKRQLMEVNLAMAEQMGPRSKNMRPAKRGRACVTDSCYCQEYKGKSSKMTKEDRQKMYQEMKSAKEAYDAKLQKIMTQDQYAAYLRNQADRIQKMKSHRR